MSSPTEQQLRDLFASEASAAPQAVGLTDGTLRKVRHRRRVRTAWAVGMVGVVVLTVGGLTSDALDQQRQNPPMAVPSDPTAEVAPPGGEGATDPRDGDAVGGGAAQECAEDYSPAAVAGRSFAFDGTVTAIGPAGSNRSGVASPLAGVTFRVNEWFHGGAGQTVTVDMDAPPSGSGRSDASVPAYGIGTRLLVSGEPRWGGPPLDAAIAWGCGFTRDYTAQTAAEWADATR